jgi:hypothetical protein
MCITHENDRLASADSYFAGMCVHQTWLYWWQQHYRRWHGHRFCRCVYAHPKPSGTLWATPGLLEEYFIFFKKLVHTSNRQMHVSAKHVDIFRDVQTKTLDN